MSLFVPARVPSVELLDAGVPREEARKSLADIEWVHRRLGGRRLVRRTLLPIAVEAARSGRPPRLLDAGCGSGHVGRDLSAHLSRHGIAARVLGLDLRAEHARMAPRGSAAAGHALRLPFASGAFDVVFSTLLFHHFSPEEARAFLTESARVARRAVVAFDLSRHRAAIAAVSLLGPLVFRTHVSVADGRASVCQAYTPREAAALAAQVLPGCEVRPAGPFAWRLVWRRP